MKIARQKEMGVEKVKASKVHEPGAYCQRYRFEVLISDEFIKYACKDSKKARLMRLLSEEIDRQLEEE